MFHGFILNIGLAAFLIFAAGHATAQVLGLL